MVESGPYVSTKDSQDVAFPFNLTRVTSRRGIFDRFQISKPLERTLRNTGSDPKGLCTSAMSNRVVGSQP